MGQSRGGPRRTVCGQCPEGWGRAGGGRQVPGTCSSCRLTQQASAWGGQSLCPQASCWALLLKGDPSPR